MNKSLSKTKSLISLPSALRKKGVKLQDWNKFAPGLKLEHGSQAVVVSDKQGVPRGFIFDAWAFLDLLSGIDEALIDKLSDKEYFSKISNMAGWLIDEIEEKLPVSDEFAESLRQEVVKAENGETVPWAEVKKLLQL